MPNLPDVDIDVRDRDTVVQLFPFTAASELNPDGTKLVRHKTGVYPQAIPVDPETGLAAFPYGHAEELGYYKIDLIVNHVYDQISSPAHLKDVLSQPIRWSWFLDPRFYAEETPIEEPLTHLGSHYKLVVQYPPESIQDIAMLLAMVRPGKRALIGQPWEEVQKHIWTPVEGPGYSFKKSHAMAFAVLVGLHARLIAAKLG